ncbi:MAG: type IX secretion system protein PorQ [Muribaculaceae bacterium]|nr:type IX secretion system protein PorQ [Muribaculaceae bacterium]
MLLALIVLAIGNIAAQNGSTAYNFLDITTSARIYGMGGMNISLVDDDISVVDQNPALLGSEMNNMVGLNYMRYLGGSNFAGIRYAHSAGTHGAWAASVQYFGYGSMKEALEDGTIVGTFSPQDISFSGTYSHDFTDMLRGGIALKFLYSAYAEYNAFALATDLGINYYDPDKDLSLSVVLANLGGQVKRFNETYNRLPFDVRIGWSQSFGSFPVRFSITAWNLTRWRLPYMEAGDGSSASTPQLKDTFASNFFRHLVFSADLITSPNYYVSLGYNYKTRTDMNTYSRSILSGFTIGGGLKVKNFGVGVALAQPHAGGTTFMFNLSYNFNDLIH